MADKPPEPPILFLPDEARPGTAADPMWRDADDHPMFRHRPKVIGAEITFKLEPDALVWSDGKHKGRLPLHQIESVRIVFRPANLYMQRYRVDVRQRLGQRVWFSNVSYRGMVEMESHDKPFSAFVRELMRRVAKASPKAQFFGGEPLWRYVPGAIVTAMLAAALGFMGVEAVRTLNWSMLAIVVLIGGFTTWQMGQWLVKNKPVAVDPANPPDYFFPNSRNRSV